MAVVHDLSVNTNFPPSYMRFWVPEIRQGKIFSECMSLSAQKADGMYASSMSVAAINVFIIVHRMLNQM